MFNMDPEKSANPAKKSTEKVSKAEKESINQSESSSEVNEGNVNQVEEEICIPTNSKLSKGDASCDSSKNTESTDDDSKKDQPDAEVVNSDENASVNVSTKLADGSKENETNKKDKADSSNAEFEEKSSVVVIEEISGTSPTDPQSDVSKDTDDKEIDELGTENSSKEKLSEEASSTENQNDKEKSSATVESTDSEKSESSSSKVIERLTEKTGELEEVTVEEEKQVQEPDVEKDEATHKEKGDEKENGKDQHCDSSAATNDTNPQDKDETQGKNIVEPENTEFVQISQDKQDDSQIEGQPIEAEDPFGGDSLAADTVESMDTDDINERNINFSELGDQADNLQDVVNAKSSGESSKDMEKTNDCPNVSAPAVTTDVIDLIQEEKEKTSEVSSESQDMEAEKSKTSDDKETQEKNDDKDKNKGDNGDDILSVGTSNEEQSTVLPGQDDELCIVPDTMKIVMPTQTKVVTETTKDNGKNENGSKELNKDGGKVMKITVRTESNLIATDKIAESKKSSGITVRTTKSVTDSGKSDQIQTLDKTNEIQSIEITDDVIDVESSRNRSENQEINIQKCKQCNEENICTIQVKIGPGRFSVCSRTCQELFLAAHGKATDIPSDGANSKYEKRCACCLLIVETDDERNLSWETMEFCNEECLGKFQTKYGSYCRNCNGQVQSISLGKYCVRFGYDVRQFCCSTCLEEFKKGLKVCSYCQKDISSGTDGFLAPVGEKGQFKDFCTQHCMEKYSRMNSTEPPSVEKKACSVCQEQKIVHCEVAIDRGSPQAMCSEPCFAAFKFVNKVDPDQCSTCRKYFEVVNKKNTVVFYNNEPHTFCSKSCLNIFIITNRKIVPCNWCKVKKYNFDMIKKELKSGQVVMMCSLNCLTLYQVSIQAVSARRVHCDLCKEFSQAQYHLTMSDATIRNFCSYNCVMKFQGQYTKSPITIPTSGEITSTPVPTGMPKRTLPMKLSTLTSTKKSSDMQSITLSTNVQTIQPKKTMPVISSVSSLAPIPSNGQTTTPISQKLTTVGSNPSITTSASVGTQSQVVYKQQVITRPASPITVHNKMTQCKPLVHTKGVSARPHPCVKSTQTDEVQKILIPIPVPIYVPFPVHMFSFPVPVPLPFPIPIPVPIFIPTTRNTTKGILKEMKKIQEKMPSDPFEAELVMMAGMVATEKKENDSDSDSSSDEATPEPLEPGNITNDDDENNEVLDTCNLDLALEMTSGEIPEPAVDLEAALVSNTITAPTQNREKSETVASDTVDSVTAADSTTQTEQRTTQPTKGRKRAVSSKSKSTPNKRGRKSSAVKDSASSGLMLPPSNDGNLSSTPKEVIDPVEKPDANMALKYTFGVNAWRQWVSIKNAELQKQDSPARKVKLFKTELLQLTADELNYSLCLFVKEVRKPNGAEYAPDTIYYLCLGIQQYLFENNRIDNIFTDTYYEKFTDCLDDIAKKFSVLYNEAQYIVTRVEEEHLWECKQLGAHSPHVLLSTLMFFNTKHFNLTSVDEHMQLSFSHIMKHWKRNPAAQNVGATGKAPGSRNVLLRFYPPQSALEANSKKKKVYEQQENEENPLRCPVKLYEFYLSKCPESVKTRNDVFYLLPERSCVPDSPVWYSTSPLAKENLVKMLNRVKIVKEINVSLRSS